ncbi:hypothetical protein DBR06_SOUSAS23110024, partial [Sousa chinensis]
ADVNVALRKIANLLKPDKEIVQDGDHMIIRTLSTFRNYIMDFQVGEEFEEDLTGIDDRKCMGHTAPLSFWPLSIRTVVGEQIREPSSWANSMTLYEDSWSPLLSQNSGQPPPKYYRWHELTVLLPVGRMDGPLLWPSLGPCTAEKPFSPAAQLEGGHREEHGWGRA